MHDFINRSKPYNYTNKEINQLKEATPFEIDLFMSGDRFKAVKFYCSRNNIKDLKLVAWFFLSISKKAYDIKNTMKDLFGANEDDFTAEQLLLADEILYLEEGNWNLLGPKKSLKSTNKKKIKKEDKDKED